MNNAKTIVDQMLSEAPVDAAQVGNPGSNGPKIYKAIKAQDVGLSRGLRDYLNVDDGATIEVGTLQMVEVDVAEFSAEASKLLDTMERLGVDWIVL
jgi:hypothetical protein